MMQPYAENFKYQDEMKVLVSISQRCKSKVMGSAETDRDISKFVAFLTSFELTIEHVLVSIGSHTTVINRWKCSGAFQAVKQLNNSFNKT